MEFDRKFSLGNLVTIGTVIVGLTTGYVTLVSGTERNTRDISTLDARVSNLESNFRDLLRQLGDKEIVQTRVLTEMQTDLGYIKEAVNKLGQ